MVQWARGSRLQFPRLQLPPGTPSSRTTYYCLLLTYRYAVFSYYYAFVCLFCHVTLVGLLFCWHTPWLLLPLAAMLLLLWFLPYVVLGLFCLARPPG